MKKRISALLLALCLAMSLFAGCSAGKTASEGSTKSETESTTAVSAEENAEPAAPQPEETASAEAPSAEETSVQETPMTVEYPLCDPNEVELTVYMAMAGFIPMVIPDVANVGFDTTRGVQLVEEATGVDLKWTLIDQDSYSEQFSIVLASGDYPDYFSTPENYVSGGIDSLVDQEICIDLAPMLDTCLPDFKNAVYSEVEDYRKAITSDTGKIVTIYNYERQSTTGLYIRQDWLDKLGLEVPATYDQLHDVLVAFKDDGVDYPMLLTQNWDYANNAFAGGYETSGYGTSSDLGYFVQDGKVQAGLLSDNFKDYISMLHDWYAEGLIGEPTMNIVNIMQINEYLLSNQCGFGDGQSDTLSESSREAAGGDYNMRAIPFIVRNEGDTFKLYENAGQPGTGGWAITTACAEPEIAAKVINWFWTDEGYTALNFGVEGETYNIVDGDVQFTDIITNNPNGFNAMFNTCSEICFFDMPFDFSMERKAATFSNDAEMEAQTIWRSNTSNEMRYYGSLSIEESEAYISKAGDLSTLAAENVSKFVTGDRAMEEWDTFLDSLYSMGIEDCVAIKQAAYDRYCAR